MLSTLAIYNYRSLRDLVIPLERLNIVTGPNGSGKSNLYVGSSRVDLQACKLEYSIVSPK